MPNGMKELRRQVGQLLILGFEEPELTPRLQSLLRLLQPGGTVLFQRNIVSATQTFALNMALDGCTDVPLFRCVDLEGGSVDRFRHVLAPSPSAFDVWSTGDKRLFRRHGELLGREARALGFNVDFAPVSDLGTEVSHAVMGKRTTSAQPSEVIGYVRGFLRGMRAQNVLGSGKHFPGLGSGTLDSHHDLPVIEKAFKDLWREDLLPYRKLKSDFPFVLAAHCAYPRANKDASPASLSPFWLTQVLRRKIGYRGLIVSDDLEMKGALQGRSIGEASVATLRAGADVFMICRTEELVLSGYEAVLRKAESDPRFRRQVGAAAERVLAFKKRSAKLLRPAAGSPSAPIDERTVEALRRDIQSLHRAIEKASESQKGAPR